MNDETKDYVAEVIDDNTTLTIAELSHSFGITGEQIVAMVEEAIITPKGASYEEWLFQGDDIRRIRISIQLQRDLQVNLAGAGLALDLLDKIEDLKKHIRAMEDRSPSKGNNDSTHHS